MVLVYTIFGGMWSVAFTDLFQTVVILIGLTLVALLVGDLAGGAGKVIAQAAADGKLDDVPGRHGRRQAWWAMAGAFFAFAFGSIPQQDVFQRMTSAKDENTAVRGTHHRRRWSTSASPSCRSSSPTPRWSPTRAAPSCSPPRTRARSSASCPTWCSGKMPMWAQMMFFGALLSAILSTASGALLAPTATFTENVLRPFVPQHERPAVPAARCASSW